MEPNGIAALILAAAAALAAFLVKARLDAGEEDRDALEKSLAERSGELWTANAQLRVAALSRREDGKRIQLYRRIFAEVPVGLAVLRVEDPSDPESWLIVEFNPAGLRLAGTAGRDPAGLRLFDFAPETRDGELPRAIAEALLHERSVEISDYVSRERVPGGRFTLNVFPLGAPLVGIAFENVTTRKAAEESLVRSNTELTQFALVASHDLQAPLRKIVAFSDRLAKNIGRHVDEENRDILKRIAGAAAGMQSLIDGLLELARVDASAEERREVDLRAAADEVLAEFEEEIARRRASVVRGELPVVLGDPAQLRRLLANLVGNALKFTPADRAPRVTLRSATREDGRAELVVEDEGAGFEMGFAGKLFQPFSRLHSRKDFPGNGMGLAICRKIVERHGGTISVRSVPGRGTRFSVVLPAAPVKEISSWNSASTSS